MKGLATLRARIARQEVRLRHRQRVRRPVLLALYDAPEPTGVRVAGKSFERLPGEPLEALMDRAAAHRPGVPQMALYGPEIRAEDDDAMPPMPAPPLPHSRDGFPWHLAGIGVIDKKMLHLHLHPSNAGMS